VNVVVLASGEGSNFEALVRGAKNYTVTSLISDKANCGAVRRAKALSIRSIILQDNLLGLIKQESPDLVALAGFMRILKPNIVDEFCCINIHPSLLPKYPGLDTHKRALSAGEHEHGCTVHLVDHGVDTGPKIAQSKLTVKNDDTEDSLRARVKELEHTLFPWVLNNLSLGEISIERDISPPKICYSAGLRSEANSKGFIL